ncbi:choice-of-anchor L domain-containing protein [uncultured Flavobacterium sp.]|uniref:DUF7619 domain-containing protein n=1 Tax=uncultured Flavobacterium sp. TaxID=165435 RepID=UPI0030EB5A9C|tara:strand:- start:227116 stop:229296 length:2181 start_codon:yes stop_codon:yes gene_type:complete
MKTKLLLLLFVTSFAFSQAVQITPYNSSVPMQDLVNNVFINTNCAIATNVQSQGVCGIGIFTNTNPNFPFQNGLVLRNGNASFSSGQYTSANTSSICSNLGDVDLLAISQANGNTGSINDVTYLKFDFIAQTNAFNFNFVFSSNEYGLYQCSFADVFAFILTDLTTGISQNLAVIPGTTTPVSVTNIRDVAYNASCSSVNPIFFDTYTLNQPATSTVMNMKGYTVPMSVYANIVPNNPYSIKMVIGDYNDTAFDSAVFIEGGSFNAGNVMCNNDLINMISFLDSNNNGTKDAGEPNFSLGSFVHELNNNGNPMQLFSPFGNSYLFPINYSDTHDLSYQIDSNYAGFYTTSTTYNDFLIAQNSGITTYYFPIVNTVPYSDVAVAISPNVSAVPGFTQINTVSYTNSGTTAANGTITLNHSSNVSILSVSESGAISTATGFTFDYTNLLPLETRTIDVIYSIPTIPTVNLGDMVTTDVSITSSSTEINSNNNIFQLNEVIVGSYDPNDIMESHGELIEVSEFDSSDYLYYTIRFQNTGTANANKIRIKDILPAGLNKESIVMVNASHDYTLTRSNNELEWFFNNIFLVPQIVSDELSQGFVTFKIKPTAGFTTGTTIDNSAEIYFDFNPAIITNTFQTQFVNALNVENKTLSNFVIYPNPTNDILNIQNRENSIITKVNVIDLLGKTIFTSKYEISNVTVDLSNLNSGIYFVEIYSNDLKTVQKVIKK